MSRIEAAGLLESRLTNYCVEKSCTVRRLGTMDREDGVMTAFSLVELGWQSFFEAQVDAMESEHAIPARVFAHFGSQVVFQTPRGQKVVPTSIVELEPGSPNSQIAVGDWFLLAPESLRGIRRLERKTVLSRKAAGEEAKRQLIAANIDTAFIVASCNKEFNLSRIERYLATVLEAGCIAVVVLTKADLCDDSASLCRQVRKMHAGLIVEAIDARDPEQTAVLNDFCTTGKTVAMLGSSGVGKSTLLNAMGRLAVRTGEIREADGKGRHTTTARSMHRLCAGGWLVDSPGMREFQIANCEGGVAELFDDIIQLEQSCRFRNCQHEQEPGCAIRRALDSGELNERRYASFRKLASEQRRNAMTLAEKRENEKRQGAYYKKVIAGKKKLRDC